MQGRILHVIIEFDKQKFQILNIYAPNKPNQRPLS